MNPMLITMIVFLAGTFTTALVGLVIRDLAVAGSGARRSSSPAISRLSLARDVVEPRSLLGTFDQWFGRVLVESGLQWTMVTALLVLILVGSSVGGSLFVLYESPLLATMGALTGVAFTILILAVVRVRHMRHIQEQLPVGLDLLARAVHAGESLEQAIRLVGERSPEPLATEFRRCAAHIEMGLSMTATMRALVFRLPMLDVRIFATTLNVHRRAGGNLAETLERLAQVIRERLTVRRQLRATLAAGRLSTTFMLVLGPVVFAYMFLGQRQYINGLLESQIGQSLLVSAVVLEVIGVIWVTRMLRTAEH